MHQIFKRSFSALLALVLCLSLLATVRLPQAQAATYTANWGTRGEEATELSSTAVSFYKDAGVTYSGLSGLSGSSTVGNVPGSALYKQLHEIMTTYHTYETDYDETKNLYMYTDCQGGNANKLTCLYCGAEYDAAWPYGGDPWNREHTWPKSKSLDGNDSDVDQVDEEDIMLLRPACARENTSRSNKAYGSTTNDNYFYPNLGSQDVRGDLARTMLYVYVRYENASYMWGSAGVIESDELLLQWMEEDPVDTWEMGRNDAVQSITGTRNIFIDYPELGFLLFGQSVPANYPTPSGGVDSGSGASVTVSFRENGTLTANLSANEGAAFTFPAAKNAAPDGYSFAGWVAGALEETTSRPTTIYTPGGSALAGNRTYHALYTKVDQTQTGNDYVLHTGAITEGDYLLIAAGGAMSTAANGTADRRDAIPVTVTDNTVYSPDAALIWHIAPTDDGYYTFYNTAAQKYAAANGTSNKLVISGTLDDYAKWSISGGVITNKGNQAKTGTNYTLRRNNTYGFACYAASTGSAPALYKAASGTVIYTTTVENAACQHASIFLSGKVAATCTTAGYSGDTVCLTCGETLSTGSVIAATGHSYTNGTCSTCGAADPSASNPDAAAGSYMKVTTAPTSWEGTYLIVYENGTTANVFNGQDTVNGYISTSISNSTISGSEELAAVAVTIESMTGGYAIQINGQYLSGTSGSNNLNFKDSQQLNTIALNDDATVQITSNTSVLRFNSTSNQMRFRYYKSTTYTSQKAICLYRLVEAPEAPKVAQVGEVQYESFADAYTAANGQPIKLLANLGSNTDYYALALTKDVTIDLNGYFGYISTTGDHTVYGMDTITTDYSTEEYGALYTTGAAVAAADGYLALEEDTNAHSFHAYEFAITHISLQPYADALGYKAQLKGDYRILAASSYGFHMGAQLNVTKSTDGAPTNGIFTLRLKNIMAAGGGEIPVTASAFVVIEGQTLTTQVQTTSMKDTVIAVNNQWSSLSTTQQNAVRALYGQYSATMSAWLGDDNNIA